MLLWKEFWIARAWILAWDEVSCFLNEQLPSRRSPLVHHDTLYFSMRCILWSMDFSSIPSIIGLLSARPPCPQKNYLKWMNVLCFLYYQLWWVAICHKISKVSSIQFHCMMHLLFALLFLILFLTFFPLILTMCLKDLEVCLIYVTWQVRSTARMCYRMFAKTWPERSRRLFMSFDPVIQRVYCSVPNACILIS